MCKKPLHRSETFTLPHLYHIPYIFKSLGLFYFVLIFFYCDVEVLLSCRCDRIEKDKQPVTVTLSRSLKEEVQLSMYTSQPAESNTQPSGRETLS